ncbi:MAG: four helix bundle protein [Candidatus Riflebacteria bacterium]|nr:four helix bundle protein [Candidatus Riflebacteria bacterium]
MMMARPESVLPGSEVEPPLFTKGYDLVTWLIQETLRFPHLYRGTLVARLHDAGIALLVHLQAARFAGARRASALSLADVELDTLRVLLRLAKDLRVLSIKKYLSGAERLREIGKMIGGWKKPTVKKPTGSEVMDA